MLFLLKQELNYFFRIRTFEALALAALARASVAANGSVPLALVFQFVDVESRRAVARLAVV